MYDNMTLKEAEEAVVDEFSMYDEWLDKYEYLIELGKNLKDYPESAKTDDKLIKGCQSRVWLDYYIQDGKVFFQADSDAIITKGIISLLISIFNHINCFRHLMNIGSNSDHINRTVYFFIKIILIMSPDVRHNGKF